MLRFAMWCWTIGCGVIAFACTMWALKAQQHYNFARSDNDYLRAGVKQLRVDRNNYREKWLEGIDRRLSELEDEVDVSGVR